MNIANTYTYAEQTDMHLICGIANDYREALTLYRQRIFNPHLPSELTFDLIRNKLRKEGTLFEKPSALNSEGVSFLTKEEFVELSGYSFTEKTHMHIAYGRASSVCERAQRIYWEKFGVKPRKRLFEILDEFLRTTGRFDPIVVRVLDIGSSYTHEEQANMNFIYWKANLDSHKAKFLYEKMYPNARPPIAPMFQKIHEKLVNEGRLFGETVGSQPELSLKEWNYLSKHTCENKTMLHCVYGAANQASASVTLLNKLLSPSFRASDPSKELFELLHRLLCEHGKFELAKKEVKLVAKAKRWEDYTYKEQTNMHLVYGLVGKDKQRVVSLYKILFPKDDCPPRNMFSDVHKRLKQEGRLFGENRATRSPIVLSQEEWRLLSRNQQVKMHKLLGYAQGDARYATKIFLDRYPQSPMRQQMFQLVDQLLKNYGVFCPSEEEVKIFDSEHVYSYDEQANIQKAYACAKKHMERAMSIYKITYPDAHQPPADIYREIDKRLRQQGRLFLLASKYEFKDESRKLASEITEALWHELQNYSFEELTTIHYIHCNTWCCDITQAKFSAQHRGKKPSALLIERLHTFLQHFGAFIPPGYNINSIERQQM